VEFYARMLVPTVMMRHKETAYVSSFAHIKQIFNLGYLLGLYRDSQWVAGTLISEEGGKETRVGNFGCVDGDPHLLHNHVTSALYLQGGHLGKGNRASQIEYG